MGGVQLLLFLSRRVLGTMIAGRWAVVVVRVVVAIVRLFGSTGRMEMMILCAGSSSVVLSAQLVLKTFGVRTPWC